MKTFKIFGNGIGTNKTYKSLEDAKNAIQENKIEPLIDNLCVIIEETIKKTHKIHVEAPTLSKENKQFLIDYVKNNLTTKTIASRDNLSNILFVIKYCKDTYNFVKSKEK